MMQRQTPSFNRISRRVIAITFLANGVGALTTFLFFSFIYPIPTIQNPEPGSNGYLDTVLFIVVTGLLLFIGGSIDRSNSNKIRKAYESIQSGAAPDEIPESTRRLVLNYVPRGALIALVMWLIAATTFSLQTLGPRMQVSDFLQSFVGIFGVGGVMATAVDYFGSELIWRPVIPVFFPAGDISRVRAFRLSVLTRLLFVFFLVSVLPLGLITMLSIQRAQMMVTAPAPQLILNNLLVMSLFIVGVSLVVSVSLVILVTRGITAPLQELQTAMARVERNDFSAQVMVNTTDELGYLGEHFNQMTAGLRQGETLRNLLNLYVTPEVAREAMEHGVQLGGRLVNCTVLFADIRDFTGLSERLPPEKLIRMLNRYMSAMVAAVVEQGGLVNKFGGDSLLAVFGTPLNPAEDHASRAVRAAIEMLGCLQDFNRAQQIIREPALRIGIGLATGKVVAGNVGGHDRVEYTVIGDTVNLAARLQGLTKDIGRPVLISAATWEAAGPAVNMKADRISGLHVRGREEPVDVYAVGDLAEGK